MKKKLIRIWGVGLALVLVMTLLLSALPAAAGTLSWGSYSTPSATNNILANGSDITDMAVGSDGMTVWVADGAGPALYMSDDGGETFSSKSLPSGLTTPALVAIAPDDSDIMVVGGDTTEAYVTTNGGSSWGSLGTIQESGGAALATMLDIAISPDDNGTHYVAVAGTEATQANIWYFDLGATTPSWSETNDLTDFGDGTVPDSAFAVAFSPNFVSDKVMVALTEEDSAPQVDFEIFSFSTDQWNDTAGFTSYPVEVTNTAGLTSAVGDISLAPDYLGSDDSTRVAFAAIDVTATADTADGIYRLKDTSLKALSTGKDAGSIAFDGTNLVAGEVAGNTVWRSDDPLASSPSVSASSNLKSPGGDNNVSVAWAGADVFAGTTGASSSFNVSRDNGKSFNGLSLVDETTIDYHDFIVSADGSTVYLSMDDGTDFSLWRQASSWERVLAVDSKTDLIVRMAPDDPNAVYVADAGTKTMYYSADGGENKWFVRSSRYNVQDMAVESADVIYVGVNGAATVSKSTNSGFTWGSAKGTGLTSGNVHMIQSLSEDNLIVGSTNGYVAWSSDGNSSWSKSTKQLDSAGNAQVTASGLEDGDFIYGITDGAAENVRRWEIGESSSWKDIINGTVADGAYGIGLDSNGALYVLGSDTATDSTVWRALSPSSASSSTTWSTVVSTGETFIATPRALQISEGSTVLWAIDTTGDATFSLTDTLVAAGPELAGPADGAEVMVNYVSGGTFTVPLSWSRASKATSYDLQIALDSGFDEKIVTATVASTSSTVSSVQGGGNFMPETTYFWRVRADSTGPVYSPWSTTRSFSISALPEQQPPVVIEQPSEQPEIVVPAPEVTVQAPEINIPPAPTPEPAPAPEIVMPEQPAPTQITPAFIWAIIIIGAILVIALIVLIVRTRRPA